MTDQPDQPGDPFIPPDPDPELAATIPAAGVGSPADLGTRFLARLIDGILLAIVGAVILVPLIIGAMFAGANTGFNPFGGFGISSIVGAIITAALYVGYFAFMESRTGQTVGKMVLGLKTIGPDGNNPTIEQAIKRNAWMALSIIPVLGGLAQLAAAIYIAVTINSSPTNTGWHDEFADGTSVIRIK
ncbi:hypothetical protein BH23ACT5_BH23ACT5_02730 [soil metagenome]